MKRPEAFGSHVALSEGRVKIYEFPSAEHETVIRYLDHLIWSYNDNVGSTLKSTGSMTLITGVNSARDPDTSISPLGRPLHPSGAADRSHHPYPTVVIEVGWSESIRSLHSLAADYFSPRTDIRVYLALKFWPKDVTTNTCAMVALLYRRSNNNPTIPVKIISFGNRNLHHTSRTSIQNNIGPISGVGMGGPPCDQAGLNPYRIRIRKAEIFHNVAVPPEIHSLYLDLFQVQQKASL